MSGLSVPMYAILVSSLSECDPACISALPIISSLSMKQLSCLVSLGHLSSMSVKVISGPGFT